MRPLAEESPLDVGECRTLVAQLIEDLDLEVPAVVAVGEAGCGKSSVLSVIGDVELPVCQDGESSMCPTVIRTEYNGEAEGTSRTVEVHWESEGQPPYMIQCSSDTELTAAIRDAHSLIASAAHNLASSLAIDRVDVTIRSPKRDAMILVDLPGANKIAEHGSLCEHFVDEYLLKKHSILLCVKMCGDSGDLAARLCNRADPGRSRTVLVANKSELLYSSSAEGLSQHSKEALETGCPLFLTKCRSPADRACGRSPRVGFDDEFHFFGEPAVKAAISSRIPAAVLQRTGVGAGRLRYSLALRVARALRAPVGDELRRLLAVQESRSAEGTTHASVRPPGEGIWGGAQRFCGGNQGAEGPMQSGPDESQDTTAPGSAPESKWIEGGADQAQRDPDANQGAQYLPTTVTHVTAGTDGVQSELDEKQDITAVPGTGGLPHSGSAPGSKRIAAVADDTPRDPGEHQGAKDLPTPVEPSTTGLQRGAPPGTGGLPLPGFAPVFERITAVAEGMRSRGPDPPPHAAPLAELLRQFADKAGRLRPGGALGGASGEEAQPRMQVSPDCSEKGAGAVGLGPGSQTSALPPPVDGAQLVHVFDRGLWLRAGVLFEDGDNVTVALLDEPRRELRVRGDVSHIIVSDPIGSELPSPAAPEVALSELAHEFVASKVRPLVESLVHDVTSVIRRFVTESVTSAAEQGVHGSLYAFPVLNRAVDHLVSSQIEAVGQGVADVALRCLSVENDPFSPCRLMVAECLRTADAHVSIAHVSIAHGSGAKDAGAAGLRLHFALQAYWQMASAGLAEKLPQHVENEALEVFPEAFAAAVAQLSREEECEALFERECARPRRAPSRVQCRSLAAMVEQFSDAERDERVSFSW
ncbi:hypothetical protein DIPPA_35240 [Diplonema papillatum]|nr:hypothetical protein DIPPA_07231 [Diplonema papillatum]KAJ9439174.1 hypothetical protein DIPPA_35240 [Diplonema papillatum]